MPKHTEKTVIIKPAVTDELNSPPQTAKTATETAVATQPKKRRGCPSQYYNKVEPYLADIGRYARCGVTEKQLCEYYGVGTTQWAQYKKQFSELTETLFKAKTEFKTRLVNRAFEIAMGYEYDEITEVTYTDEHGNRSGGKRTVKKCYAKADAGMAQFLLINRFPEEFARDPQMVEARKKALELAQQGKLPPDGFNGV